jgi:hypothetical protein
MSKDYLKERSRDGDKQYKVRDPRILFMNRLYRSALLAPMKSHAIALGSLLCWSDGMGQKFNTEFKIDQKTLGKLLGGLSDRTIRRVLTVLQVYGLETENRRTVGTRVETYFIGFSGALMADKLSSATDTHVLGPRTPVSLVTPPATDTHVREVSKVRPREDQPAAKAAGLIESEAETREEKEESGLPEEPGATALPPEETPSVVGPIAPVQPEEPSSLSSPLEGGRGARLGGCRAAAGGARSGDAARANRNRLAAAVLHGVARDGAAKPANAAPEIGVATQI